MAKDSYPIGGLVKESRLIEFRRNCVSQASFSLPNETKRFFNEEHLVAWCYFVLSFHMLVFFFLCFVFCFGFPAHAFAFCIKVVGSR